MRNSVNVWFGETEVPTIDFQADNDMVILYWGKDLEICVYIEELKHLAERINQFLKETNNVTSTR